MFRVETKQKGKRRMNVSKVFVSSANHSAKDGYCAKYSGGVVVVCSAITDQAVGIISKGGTAAEAVTEVVIFGEAKAILGGTVTAGQMVTPHTDSTVVASAGAGCAEFGIALESGVAGDTVNVFVYGSNTKFA
jgi:hypothetical protein